MKFIFLLMFMCSAFSITQAEFKSKYKNKIDSIDLFETKRNEKAIEFCTDLVLLLDRKKYFNYIKNESYLSSINSVFHRVTEYDYNNNNKLFSKFEDLLKGNCDFGLTEEEFLKSNFVYCLSEEEFNKELKDFVKTAVELPKRNSPCKLSKSMEFYKNKFLLLFFNSISIKIYYYKLDFHITIGGKHYNILLTKIQLYIYLVCFGFLCFIFKLVFLNALNIFLKYSCIFGF